MKKTLILFTLILSTIAINAQENNTKTTMWGVNIGTNINLFNKEKYLNEKGLLPGIILGVNYQKPINEKWSFKSGVNFVTKRNTGEHQYVNLNNETGLITRTVNQHNISVPVLFVHQIKQSDYFINMGTVLNYQFNETIKIKGGFDLSDTINETVFDVGLSFGFGKKINSFGKNYLDVELRNDLDVLTIKNVDYNIKTNVISLMVSYNFM